MPGNNNEMENRLWDMADELRANSRLTAYRVFSPGPGVNSMDAQGIRGN